MAGKAGIGRTSRTQRRTYRARRSSRDSLYIFSWAIGEGIVDVSRVVGANWKADENMRERVLADDEIPDIWNACPRRRLWMDCPLLILTAIRRDAVGGAAKDEVCLPDRKGSIDGARMPRG